CCCRCCIRTGETTASSVRGVGPIFNVTRMYVLPLATLAFTCSGVILSAPSTIGTSRSFEPVFELNVVGVAKSDVIVAGVLVLLDAIRFDPGSDEFGGKGIERGTVWRSKADVVEADPVFVKAVAGNRLARGDHEDPRWPSLEPEA